MLSRLAILTVLLLYLAACSTIADTPAAPATSLPTTESVSTHTPSATPSPTPVGDIGWRQVSGVVYTGEAAPGNELSGAQVRCSQHSYSTPPETSCAPHQLVTSSAGAFEFSLFVHDTDGMTISAEKAGYRPDEQRIGGFDCVGACPQVTLVLESID